MPDAGIDTFALATEELTEHAIPDPEMILPELSPFAQVYYAKEITFGVLRQLTAAIAADTESGLTEDDGAVKCANAVAMAAGQLFQACVCLGIHEPTEPAP
jgi:hypothetical protein